MSQVNTESELVSNTIADKDNQDNEATSNNTSNNTSNKRPLPSISDTAASPTQQQIFPEEDHLPVAKKARSEQPATTAAVTTSPSTIAGGGGTIKPATSIFGSSTSSGFAAFGSSATPSSIFGSSTTTTGFGQKSSAFTSTSTSTGFGTAAASNSNATPTTTTNNTSTSTTLPSTSNANTEGFPSSTSTSNPTTGIFGSTSIFTLGNSNENNNQEASSSTSSPNKSSNNPIVSLPINEEPVRNGEENEEAVITLRAKLFKLIKVQEKLADDRPVKSPSDAQSKKTGIQMATKVGELAEEADDTSTTAAAAATTTTTTSTDSNAHSATAAASLKDSGKMDWKEVGIGPLRVLTDQRHARIVQRRENTPGGQGTKLILNLALRDECQVERKGDKFVRLAAFEVVDDSKEEADGTTGNDSADKEDKDRDEGANEDGKEDPAVKFESVQYLFKVKTIAEADSLVDTLARYCRSSAATKD